jgi:hypothetical protein
VNAAVHYGLTKRWASEAGFSDDEAETIALADRDTDRDFSGKLSWHNKGYHFAWLGARRRARVFLSDAIAKGDLVALGRALHCEQDAIAHGQSGHLWHWPGIDIWERRSNRVRGRIETASRTMLDYYRGERYNTA